jgi:hypothetical protein
MTTVGQAGAPIGIPAEAVKIATVLKFMGYATGQFGKNHLGDKNEFLPTVHGFDEFFGYLYHLDAMEDPAHPGYPQELTWGDVAQSRRFEWATSCFGRPARGRCERGLTAKYGRELDYEVAQSLFVCAGTNCHLGSRASAGHSGCVQDHV